jgi:hypothetical protein
MSGLSHTPGKRARGKTLRGFESRPLRQNDRYRNIRTQPGFNSLGMSCDNPSRVGNPWTTLKRTDKTKSLRFVRFCQPVSAQQKSSVSCLDGHESFAVLVNSKIVYELTKTQPSLRGTRFA